MNLSATFAKMIMPAFRCALENVGMNLMKVSRAFVNVIESPDTCFSRTRSDKIYHYAIGDSTAPRRSPGCIFAISASCALGKRSLTSTPMTQRTNYSLQHYFKWQGNQTYLTLEIFTIDVGVQLMLNVSKKESRW